MTQLVLTEPGSPESKYFAGLNLNDDLASRSVRRVKTELLAKRFAEEAGLGATVHEYPSKMVVVVGKFCFDEGPLV